MIRAFLFIPILNSMKSNLILFDDQRWENLLPLTFTRPVSELRIGILTIKEKWEKRLNLSISYLTKDYLSKKFKTQITDDNVFINSGLLPDDKLVTFIKNLKPNQYAKQNDILICARIGKIEPKDLTTYLDIDQILTSSESVIYTHELSFINRPYEIFSMNETELKKDFELITVGRQSQDFSSSNTIFGKYPVFFEIGVEMECCTINTNDGPVYLGKNVQIMEGTMIRGGFAACEGSIVKMGAKIYGATTIGPNCRLGGEVNNVVMMANSNKGHDGFLGNSVIGEWCNLGADTNTSNLKNNYLPVKIWSYADTGFKDTGLQFCGLIMGDHSKSGINTMFNTGTVVGVAANIFGDGFPRTFVPSFSWGGASGFITHQLKKAIETAEIVMKRRHLTLSTEDKEILEYIFNQPYTPSL